VVEGGREVGGESASERCGGSSFLDEQLKAKRAFRRRKVDEDRNEDAVDGEMESDVREERGE
jgi:hypothetical protein